MKQGQDVAGPDAQFDLFGDAGDGPQDPARGTKAPNATSRPRSRAVDDDAGSRAAADPATGSVPAQGTFDGLEAPVAASARRSKAPLSSHDEAHGTGPATSRAKPATADKKATRKRALPVAAPEFDDALMALGNALPPEVHLGTSTWSFPGWKNIVYRDEISSTKLSREGLHAYAEHPVLGCVGIDRSFYAPLTVAQYARHAQQVPDTFRFVVKAPASICDASIRGPRGGALMENAAFLNADIARNDFVLPCLEGLGRKAGALVFQLSPLTPKLLAEPTELIERLGAFFAALPALDAYPGSPVYAIEIRDAVLLTPRFIRMLRDARVRYCIGIHARMPEVLRQAAALALLDDDTAGPLVVRWSLHAGFEYETAKAKYEPFNQIVDADPNTREALAELAARYALAGQPVLITVNNKAEGSAPLSCVELASAIVAAVENAREELGTDQVEAPASDTTTPATIPPADTSDGPASDPQT
jgi:uncharacterized protein YecE (DUF72 family)